VCSKSTNWEDLVQDDNQRVCGIPISGNLHTASLLMSMRISISYLSIMLKTCRILVYHFNSIQREFLTARDCRGL
jgi:hypothetical protein